MAASSEEAGLLEMLQLQNGDGPCLAAYREHRPIALPDIGEEGDRWPDVVPAIMDAGYASMYVVPLRFHDRVVGAVNHFRTGRGHLSEDDQALAQALADAAMLALVHWSSEPLGGGELLTRLQGAISAKTSLEIAKGMLAEYGGVDFAEAARALRDHAVRHEARITDTAEALVRRELALDAVIRPRASRALR
jgi:hypothetical protein